MCRTSKIRAYLSQHGYIVSPIISWQIGIGIAVAVLTITFDEGRSDGDGDGIAAADQPVVDAEDQRHGAAADPGDDVGHAHGHAAEQVDHDLEHRLRRLLFFVVVVLVIIVVLVRFVDFFFGIIIFIFFFSFFFASTKSSISCDIAIDKPFVDEQKQKACEEGDVRLAGQSLECSDTNGWRVKPGADNVIELVGAACTTFKGGDVTFTATFPCGTIVVE